MCVCSEPQAWPCCGGSCRLHTFSTPSDTSCRNEANPVRQKLIRSLSGLNCCNNFYKSCFFFLVCRVIVFLCVQDGLGLKFTITLVISLDSCPRVWTGSCHWMCMVSALPYMHREVTIFLDICNNELYLTFHSPFFFLLSSVENKRVLLSQGALLKCSSLLVSLGGAVAERNQEDGLELVWNN